MSSSVYSSNATSSRKSTGSASLGAPNVVPASRGSGASFKALRSDSPALVSLSSQMASTSSSLEQKLATLSSSVASQLDFAKKHSHEKVASALGEIEEKLQKVAQEAKAAGMNATAALEQKVAKLAEQLQRIATQHAQAVSAVSAAAEKAADAVKAQAMAKSAEQAKEIASLKEQLAVLSRTASRLSSQIATLEGKKDQSVLHVGEQCNLPDQPEAKKESGVWKVAPLALSVNGGIVAHDIGYTTKKGHQLVLDPETNRILVYHGK